MEGHDFFEIGDEKTLNLRHETLFLAVDRVDHILLNYRQLVFLRNLLGLCETLTI